MNNGYTPSPPAGNKLKNRSNSFQQRRHSLASTSSESEQSSSVKNRAIDHPRRLIERRSSLNKYNPLPNIAKEVPARPKEEIAKKNPSRNRINNTQRIIPTPSNYRLQSNERKTKPDSKKLTLAVKLLDGKRIELIINENKSTKELMEKVRANMPRNLSKANLRFVINDSPCRKLKESNKSLEHSGIKDRTALFIERY